MSARLDAGFGDEATWGPFSGHPNDPRHPGPDEFADLEPEKSRPISHIPAQLIVESTLKQIGVTAEAYAERIQADKVAQLQFHIGQLEATLRAYMDICREVEAECYREIQLLLDMGGTQAYEDAHAARVHERFGLIAEEA